MLLCSKSSYQAIDIESKCRRLIEDPRIEQVCHHARYASDDGDRAVNMKSATVTPIYASPLTAKYEQLSETECARIEI